MNDLKLKKRMRIFNTCILLLGTFASIFAQKKPNIIFILADDMGYGDVACFNENSKIATPNIDNLAKAGVKFTDAHTSSAVCTPTRYGILTGRYSWRSKLKSSVLFGYDKALIRQSRKTLPSFLKDNGYKTAGIGKWHLGWDWNNIEAGEDKVDFSKRIKNGPSTLGFDYFYGFSGSLDMAPYVWVENDKPTMVPTKNTVNTGKQTWWRDGPTSDDFSHELVLPHITDKTIQFIKENANKEKPFFVYMPLPAPHTPILPTAEFMGKSGLDNIYGDFVMMVDATMGRIMTTLKEQGIVDNTILIFTSDNGCSNQADFDQLATKGHDPSYVFRGHKADIFEGGHRVPYVVRWPKMVKPGSSDKLVCTTDLFASLADVLGAKIEDNVAEDSFSFLSLLKLPSSKPKRTSIVHHSINGSFAYRNEQWKTIFCPDSGGWSDPKPNSPGVEKLPPFQIYNLASDVGEEKNVLEQNPEIFSRHKKELTDIILNGRSTPGRPQKNDPTDKKWIQIEFIEK